MNKNMTKSNGLFVLTLSIISFLILFKCERDFNPFHADTSLVTEDFCISTPPDSIPGIIGEWELAGLGGDSINPINVIAINPEKPYHNCKYYDYNDDNYQDPCQ